MPSLKNKELLKALNQEETKEDKDIKQCRICLVYKIRIRHGKFPNGKDTRFVGEDGQLWNGKICPECQVLKMASHMKNKRVK